MTTIGQIRSCPAPYKAMLAICSDLDETPTGNTYFEILRFLNTGAETSIGTGVDLEVGNSIYFDMPADQFSYWNTDDEGRSAIRGLIRSGHIDCFHSFGDLATTREHVERALQDLERSGCRLECWIDHASAPTNFGADIMQGLGDVTSSDCYHADLTYDHGVRYVWRGRVTSIIGQDQPPSLRGLLNPTHLIRSAKTTSIELAKGTLAMLGNTKYGMHARNDVLRLSTLRDGSRIVEFMRCNPYWGGVGEAATASGLANVLTDKFLDRLVERRGVSVLYTHLGKSGENHGIFEDETVAAMRRLAAREQQNDILVTTTRRLLGYCALRRLLQVSVKKQGSVEEVHVRTDEFERLDLPCNLDGLTIEVSDPHTARLIVGNREVDGLERSRRSNSQSGTVSLPWKRLVYPFQ